MQIGNWITLVKGLAADAPTLIADAEAIWGSVKHLYSPTDQAAVDNELKAARTDAVSATTAADQSLDRAAQH